MAHGYTLNDDWNNIKSSCLSFLKEKQKAVDGVVASPWAQATRGSECPYMVAVSRSGWWFVHIIAGEVHTAIMSDRPCCQVQAGISDGIADFMGRGNILSIQGDSLAISNITVSLNALSPIPKRP